MRWASASCGTRCTITSAPIWTGSWCSAPKRSHHNDDCTALSSAPKRCPDCAEEEAALVTSSDLEENRSTTRRKVCIHVPLLFLSGWNQEIQNCVHSEVPSGLHSYHKWDRLMIASTGIARATRTTSARHRHRARHGYGAGTGTGAVTQDRGAGAGGDQGGPKEVSDNEEVYTSSKVPFYKKGTVYVHEGEEWNPNATATCRKTIPCRRSGYVFLFS